MSSTDSKIEASNTRRLAFLTRAEVLCGLTLFFVVLGFAVALIVPDAENGLVRLVIGLIPLCITVLSLIAFGYAIIQGKAFTLVVLIVGLGAAFLVGVSCWFAFPEKPQLEPLTTLLALDVAFIGFLSSSSGLGVLRLTFTPNQRGLGIGIHMDMPTVDDGQSKPTEG